MPHPCQAIRVATYGGSAVAFSDDALYNERRKTKASSPDEAKKRGKEKQMGVFRHKDPWQHYRAELIERGKAGTALLTAEPEAVVPILLSVSPEVKFTYQPGCVSFFCTALQF